MKRQTDRQTSKRNRRQERLIKAPIYSCIGSIPSKFPAADKTIVIIGYQTRKVALPSFVNRVKERSVIGGTAHKRPMMAQQSATY